jgi:hypothetical protein
MFIASPAIAEYKTCTLLDGSTVQCGMVGFRNPQTGAIYLKGSDEPQVDVKDNTSNTNVITSINPKNERQFTATFVDGHRSDYYIDRDGSVKKGIPPYSLP